jgi:hypothetical protein
VEHGVAGHEVREDDLGEAGGLAHAGAGPG